MDSHRHLLDLSIIYFALIIMSTLKVNVYYTFIKFFVLIFQVDFDRTNYLSERNIKKRALEAQKNSIAVETQVKNLVLCNPCLYYTIIQLLYCFSIPHLGK